IGVEVVMSKREDVRKVQLTGKSTYIVSLPRKWVGEVNLKKGEALTILEQNDKSLVLVPKGVKRHEKITEISINLSLKDKTSSIIRKIIALYLVGYNIIRLKTKEDRIPLEQRDKLKDFIRRMLVGTEIISDSKNEMVLKVLLSYPELSVADALRRISIIAISMQKDAIASLRELNHELAEEVVKTDDEVDRFSFYIIRQLKAAVEDERIIKEIGLDNPRDCLGYRLITKSAERVADHAVSIAQNVLTIGKHIDDETFRVLNDLSSMTTLEFEGSINSLFAKNYSLADEIIDRKGHVEEYENGAIKQILGKKFDAETTSSLRLIVESLKRTAEYGSDIAEVVLNLTVFQKE
ncbi:phosphate uptake regulator PhoU, partial [Candidatus Bathyarchaeota archaeon]|nr:phosphate uptake regulator PhoU [Candidatus Bathyarchaeota archaeon]